MISKHLLARMSLLYLFTGLIGFVFVMLYIIDGQSPITMINGLVVLVFSIFILAVITNYRKNYLNE